MLEVIYIFKFKKIQRCQTDTDILIEQLQRVQSDIKKLEKEKMNFDTPKFLAHKKAEDLCRELYLIFNGRCSADVLCNVDRLDRKEDKVEYLKSFGNYLLTLADSCDEYTRIKEELNNKRATEQSLKDKLGIK